MKNQKKWISTLMIFAAPLAASLAPTSAHAFALNFLDSRDVADANYCGDFNKLRIYKMKLAESERMPELGWALLTSANLAQIEQELKGHFMVPKNAEKLVIKSMGLDAIRNFAGSWAGDRDYCYQIDFSKLFSYSKAGGQLTARYPEAVTYIQVAFEQDSGAHTSLPALVVMNRRTGRLFIHQEF
jgi:hypothetical protein